MVRAAAIALALLLAGCVSTEMKTYIGRPVTDLLLDYGAPNQVLDLPDGSRAYQFRRGAGVAVLPGSSTTMATPVGSSILAQTTTTPAAVVPTEGCLLTYIARQRADVWYVEAIRVPKGLAC